MDEKVVAIIVLLIACIFFATLFIFEHYRRKGLEERHIERFGELPGMGVYFHFSSNPNGKAPQWLVAEYDGSGGFCTGKTVDYGVLKLRDACDNFVEYVKKGEGRDLGKKTPTWRHIRAMQLLLTAVPLENMPTDIKSMDLDDLVQGRESVKSKSQLVVAPGS